MNSTWIRSVKRYDSIWSEPAEKGWDAAAA